MVSLMIPENIFQTDFCRVCRCEATISRPLFYPCMCTGSIKYIHQDCLLQWLKYSKRHTCELCNHKFTFAPIYASGTPRFLPFKVLLVGLLRNLRRSIVSWLHLCLVIVAWLVVVPLTACRIYRCLFTGSVSSLLTLPLDMVSTRHLLQDCLQGFSIVAFALAAFIGYISLREQLLQGGAPAWLNRVVAGGLGDEADINGGQPFFPDIFNLFGVANGAGQGAAAEDHGNDVLDDVHVAAANTSISSFNQSNSEAEVTASISEPDVSRSPPVEPLPVQPQQYGWRATGEEFGSGEAAADGPQAAEGAADEAAVGEAMNWDRLLGLDGSLAFLEHVLWLIALNTLFIVIFAFCPYHMGQFTVLGFQLDNLIAATHMEGLSTSLVGYLIAGGVLLLFHYLFKYCDMPRACYWFGLGYIYIKVALVSLLEVGIFPILSGFWIDACTLSLFNSTLSVRVTAFHYAPMTFTFIHWAVGMLYTFYMASLLILARSVVRPGVLLFVYHFNDPDYKPIQEMIAQPLYIYAQRLIATFSIWGILIVFILWIPIEVVRRFVPGFLPFNLTVAHENPLDYSVEIILVQVALPFLLDVQAKAAVRHLLRMWCIAVGELLGIRSYLLGDIPFKPGDVLVKEDGSEVVFISVTSQSSENNTTDTNSHSIASTTFAETLNTTSSGVAASDAQGTQPAQDPQPPANPNAHGQPEYDADNVHRYVSYARPRLFRIRVIAFGLTVLISLTVISILLLTVPVSVGRIVLGSLSSRNQPRHDAVAIVTGVTLLIFMLRTARSFPVMCSAMRHLLSLLVTRMNNLFCRSRTCRVLRIWTRSGTTCEIAIPRPALPAPMTHFRTTGGGGRAISKTTAWLSQTIQVCANLVHLVGVAFVCLILLPVGIGLLINLTFIVPVQVKPQKTLIIGFWEQWIFGVMHLKVAVLLTLAGPTWWFRRRLETMQHELAQHRYRARAVLLLSQVGPLIAIVGLCLAAPYLLAHYCVSWIGIPSEYAFRYMYPGLFGATLLTVLCACQFKQLGQLYMRIKDEKYLIGRRLVNFRSASTNRTDETES